MLLIKSPPMLTMLDDELEDAPDDVSRVVDPAAVKLSASAFPSMPKTEPVLVIAAPAVITIVEVGSEIE